jgi:hypothetical protein
MHRRLIATLVVLALSAGIAQSGDAPKKADASLSGPERARIGTLIERLGSSIYEEREQARAELEVLGAAALPLLRIAARAPDAEIAHRATGVIAVTEEKLLTDKLLAPRRLRLMVQDIPVAKAVDELAAISGYPLKLEGEPSDRKVTLDTGETTFWDALEQLCRRAELIEKPIATPPPDLATPSGFGVRVLGGRKKGGLPIPVGSSPESLQPRAAVPITLMPGKLQELPACQVGSVRIRVLPPAPSFAKIAATSAEAQLVFEVTGEPRLHNLGVVALHRLDEALDDRDQLLALSLSPHSSPSAALNFPTAGGGLVINGNVVINGGRIVINRGNVIINGIPVGGPSTPAPASRTLTVHLDKGLKSAVSLRKLSGVLLVQTLTEPEPIIAVEKIMSAAGRTVKAADGRTLEILAVEKQANGDISIKAAGKNPHGPNAAGALLGNANIVINGMNLNNLNFGGTDPLTRCQPRLEGASGKACTLAAVAADQIEVVNGQPVHTITYVFRPQAGQDEPAQLTLSAQRQVTIRVPFALQDVPLP